MGRIVGLLQAPNENEFILGALGRRPSTWRDDAEPSDVRAYVALRVPAQRGASAFVRIAAQANKSRAVLPRNWYQLFRESTDETEGRGARRSAGRRRRAG